MASFHGFFRGFVLSNADPQKQGRLILQVPQVLGTKPTPWALPCWPAGWNRSLMHDHVFVDNDTGYQAGGSMTETLRHKLLVAVPGAGASVWVVFENGDPTLPVWVGMGTNASISDALLGTDSDAGSGESGDGTAIGDGTVVPSAYNSPALVTSSTPTHEHVYPVTSVNGLTGAVNFNYVTPDTTQTITGAKTFSVAPTVPDSSWSIAKTSGLQTALDSKATASSLSNYVTLDTAQTISGVKTFSAGVYDGTNRVYSKYAPVPGIRGEDTRDVVDTPTSIDNLLLERLGLDGVQMSGPEFKTAAALSLPGVYLGSYYGVVTVNPWSDDSGGGVHQLAFGNGTTGGTNGAGDLWYRYGTRAAGWLPWRKLSGGDAQWQLLPMVNGWADYGAPYYSGQYRKDNSGFVHFRGLITGGTSSDIATMPVGYRIAPNGGTTHAMGHFPIRTSGGTDYAYYRADGVLASNAYGPGAAWVDLASCPPYLAEA